MSTRPPRAMPSCVVLLAGGVSGRSLPSSIGRSVLDFPLESRLRLWEVWVQRLAELRPTDAMPSSLVRVLTGTASPSPESGVIGRAGWRIQRDLTSYRGTGGALRDLAEEFEPHEFLLVASASQCPEPGQVARLVEHADPGDGATILVDEARNPTGLLLIRAEALLGIAPLGFIDLKEQALATLSASHRCRVLASSDSATPPIRDRASYLDTLRSWHDSESLAGYSSDDPYRERWRPSFSIVLDGAKVHPSATVHDSVVWDGAVVEANAVVVRSVVGPAGIVPRRAKILDTVIEGSEGT